MSCLVWLFSLLVGAGLGAAVGYFIGQETGAILGAVVGVTNLASDPGDGDGRTKVSRRRELLAIRPRICKPSRPALSAELPGKSRVLMLSTRR